MRLDVTIQSLRIKLRRRLMVAGILCSIATALFLNRTISRDAATTALPSATASLPDDSDSHVSVMTVEWPLELQRDIFAWEKMFPTLPSHATPAAKAIEQEASNTIDLQAIVFQGESSQAIINGQRRQQRQSIAGFRIHRIERRHIVVEKDGVEVQIDL